MGYDRRGRRSVRLQEVSYAEAGWYFITLCTAGRACLLGEAAEGAVRLSEAGCIVEEEWHRTAVVRSYVVLDAFVVMPNHVHGVIGIMTEGAGNGKQGMARHAPTASGNKGVDPQAGGGLSGAPDGACLGGAAHPHRRGMACHALPRPRQFADPVPQSLSSIVGGFKSAVTRRVNETRDTPGAAVWQRNYYEHIVRGEKDLDRIRRYLAENPARWIRIFTSSRGKGGARAGEVRGGCGL